MQRRFWFFLPIIGLVMLLWATPEILRAVPSRYAARLPAPLQTWSAPPPSAPILPTRAAPVNAAALLQGTTGQLGTVTPTAVLTLPPPVQIVTDDTAVTPMAVSPTPTPLPTPTPTATPIPLPPSARLTHIRHQFQEWNNCGPATLAMTLSYFDWTLTQKETAAALKPNPEDRNVSPGEMAAYVNQQTDVRALYRVNGSPLLARQLLAAGFPVIVEVGIDPPGDYRWLGWYGHYLLLVAYDEAQTQFWVYDSWFGTSEEPLQNAHADGRIISYADFDTYWQQFNRTYIVLYPPEQETAVAHILGANWDDTTMWQNALATAQAETAVSPDNAFLWFNLGTVYNALGDYEAAATAFDAALSIGLPWRMLWYQSGLYEAYYQIGRYDDIVLLADVTLENRPYFEESFYYKGLALAALGQTEAAQENLEKAVAFNPNFSLAATALQAIRP